MLTLFSVYLRFLLGLSQHCRVVDVFQCRVGKPARPKTYRTVRYFVNVLIILPLVITMCFGPFFAPFIGLKLSHGNGFPIPVVPALIDIQQEVWDHRCDSYPAEVILDGRSYDSPDDQVPLASFYFGQPSLRTKYYEYSITQDENDRNIWHFNLSAVEPTVTIPTQTYPLVRDLSYRLTNRTLSAVCADTPDTPSNATVPCMEGSFKDDDFLSFTVNDTRSNTVTKLRAVDKEWAPNPADAAPSFILKEVNPDNSLGAVALRTAVRGHRTSLKLCLARETGIDILAALGLTLLRQNDFSIISTTPYSN
jgi:hypothetical protein